MAPNTKKHIAGKAKSERHHWWPECVSDFWKDCEGCVNWIMPSGEIKRSPPKNFGAIGNGHFIKLGHQTGVPTVWDQNFEPIFQKADNNFKQIISYLEGLDYPQIDHDDPDQSRFSPVMLSDDLFSKIFECLVSLAIRSPMTRESVVSLAEEIRGPLPKPERNALIAVNMRDMHRMVIDSIQSSGKIVAIRSVGKEFIFGDGFYHNILSPAGPPMLPKILAPLTPSLSVLFVRPMKYSPTDRLFAFTASPNEIDDLNNIVQIYSSQCLFYRNEKPLISDHYKTARHLRMGGFFNMVDEFIAAIPGVY